MTARLLVPLIAVCAMLGFVAPASATPPVHVQFPITDSVPDLVQCDGFVVGLEGAGTADLTVLFDETGLDVRYIVRTQETATLTNSVTGKTLVQRSEFQQFFTRIDGTDEFTHSLVGFRAMGTAPQQGVVIQDVGRLEYSPADEQVVFSAGHHFDVPGGDPDGVVCAALA